MARALIVGCGCRGRRLGQELLEMGLQVRGSTRRPPGVAPIQSAGIEAVIADPLRPASVFDQVAEVGVLYWLLGSAQAEPEAIAAIHGLLLERILEKIVDTPVRGFVYEARGSVPVEWLQAGEAVVREAEAKWRVPIEIIKCDPGKPQLWTQEMSAAGARLLGLEPKAQILIE